MQAVCKSLEKRNDIHYFMILAATDSLGERQELIYYFVNLWTRGLPCQSVMYKIHRHNLRRRNIVISCAENKHTILLEVFFSEMCPFSIKTVITEKA